MHVSCAIGHTTFGISSKQGDRNISFSKLFLQSLPGVKDIMRWNGTICCSTLTLSLVIFVHGKLLPQKFWDRTKWIYEKYLPSCCGMSVPTLVNLKVVWYWTSTNNQVDVNSRNMGFSFLRKNKKSSKSPVFCDSTWSYPFFTIKQDFYYFSYFFVENCSKSSKKPCFLVKIMVKNG